MLRVFRQSGVQLLPLRLPGPPVAMTGEGSLLAVVYHREDPTPVGPFSDGEDGHPEEAGARQNLSVKLLRVGGDPEVGGVIQRL